jgi:predicted HTH transcriptional regulator
VKEGDVPSPKEVFEHPERFWEFLTAPTDVEFEGQHFDRKEAGRQSADGSVGRNQFSNLIEEVTETISAFANKNREGGLLVLGISSEGRIKGIKHLTESQINCVTNFGTLLNHQAAAAKTVDCTDEAGDANRICLIYVPYTERHICETPGNSPKAYVRQGLQNIRLDDTQRQQVRRDKGIVEFENSYCCPYDPADLDQDVLNEFRRVYLQETDFEYSDEEMLRQAGAITRVNSELVFTNAGMLFFAANPQRVLPSSYIRLLRFDANSSRASDRGLPTFEKKFTGSITRQIRNIRTFFRESAFFKVFQRRNPEGGFLEEPEYPHIAVDEAIVNAVAHRDYAVGLPISCESYEDALVVINPGRVQQIDHDVPDQFSLDSTRLQSKPGNPKLIEWLKLMRNEQGTAFVRALSEGTERMRREMAALSLPAPLYRVSSTQTTLTLYNNVEARRTEFFTETGSETTEFANLYPLTFVYRGDSLLSPEHLDRRRRDAMAALKDALTAKGWYIDDFKFSRIVAHRRGVSIPLPGMVEGVVRFFPAYVFQVRQYFDNYFLCLDYTLEVKSVRTLQALFANFKPREFVGKRATVNWKGWQRAKIISADEEWARVYLFDFDQEARVACDKVIPQIPKGMIEALLAAEGMKFDLHQAIKQHSLSTEPSAARIRFEKTQVVAESVAENIFPLVINGTRVNMRAVATPLFRQGGDEKAFRTYSLPEPVVEFGHNQAKADIREGITKFGSYSESSKNVELVPLCAPDMREPMAALIERLKAGKYKYRGSERTFHTRFTYNSIITTPLESVLAECKRLLNEHPDWAGDKMLNRLFLIHVPEKGFAIDDEHSPYYVVKRYLLEQGIPCQMIDTPTLLNPDWKDLNLALNVVAKCGVTPWVLPDAIPDADFFIGLSYTQSVRKGGERLMGYANVFNQYGKWEFYSGNTETFTYDERAAYFRSLVGQTMEQLTLPETPSIYFHYSAKFSRDDRAAILEAARSVRPNGTYTFVWINTHHNVRLYDSRAETNGSLSRGSYVVASPNQIYLSTTGYNPFRKTLGTPHMLEINVRVERPEGLPQSPPDLRTIAVHALSLTKLNWASTDSLCAEPITIKYAGDIAYLTSAFLRQGGPFRLHPMLEKTPWFL